MPSKEYKDSSSAIAAIGAIMDYEDTVIIVDPDSSTVSASSANATKNNSNSK